MIMEQHFGDMTKSRAVDVNIKYQFSLSFAKGLFLFSVIHIAVLSDSVGFYYIPYRKW